jgi:hypothetical protein
MMCATDCGEKDFVQCPAVFAVHLTETGHRAALLDGSALRPVAQPAPQGVSTANDVDQYRIRAAILRRPTDAISLRR